MSEEQLLGARPTNNDGATAVLSFWNSKKNVIYGGASMFTAGGIEEVEIACGGAASPAHQEQA